MYMSVVVFMITDFNDCVTVTVCHFFMSGFFLPSIFGHWFDLIKLCGVACIM